MTMMNKPTVLASAVTNQSDKLSAYVGTAQLGEDPLPWLYQYPEFYVQSLCWQQAQRTRIVTATPEIDGVTRRMPLVVNVQSKLLPKLRTRTLKTRRGGDPVVPNKNRRTGYSLG